MASLETETTGQERPVTPEEAAELEEMQEAVRDAYARLEEAAERLSSRAVEAYDTGRAFVRDNPIGTLLVAVAAGVIVGILTSRR